MAKPKRSEGPAPAPHDPYDQFHLRGIDDAAEDFQEDNLSIDEGGAAFDHEDLARQYLAERRRGVSDVHGLAKTAVADYIAWFDRNEGIATFRVDYESEIEEEVVDPQAAYAAWKQGYAEGLVSPLVEVVLDAYGELIGATPDPDPDEKDDPRPKANPAGEPITYWSAQGAWDAKHAFSAGDLDDIVDKRIVDAAIDEIVATGKVEHNHVRRLASGLVDKFFDAIIKDGHEEEWIDQNRAELKSFGHLPSEAYAEWRAGYRGPAAREIASWLEERARDEMEGA